MHIKKKEKMKRKKIKIKIKKSSANNNDKIYNNIMNNDLINKIKSKKIILFGKSLKIDDIKNYAKLLEYNDEELNDP